MFLRGGFYEGSRKHLGPLEEYSMAHRAIEGEVAVWNKKRVGSDSYSRWGLTFGRISEEGCA